MGHSYKYIFIIIVISISNITCNNSNRNRLTKIIQEWQGKEIIFPDNLRIKILGKDTLYQNLFSSRYKIIHYIDTTGCTACRAKLYDWNLLQHEVDSLKANATFLFIAYVKEYKELETLLKINHCTIPCIYDTLNVIGQQNRFPNHPGLQTFLLDSLNRVIFIGNPTENIKIRELYLKKMQTF